MEKKKLVAIISPDDIQAILLADDGSLIHLRVVPLEKWVTLNEDGSHIDDDDYIGLTISEGYLDQCNDFANFLGFWDAKLGTATPDDFTHEIGWKKGYLSMRPVKSQKRRVMAYQRLL